MSLRVYIGWDDREPEAGRVAAKTLKEVSGLDAEFLKADRLRDAGMLSRITDHRGQHYDLVSNAPKSTAFAVSRFLTPLLCQGGHALFVDCDVVFLRDPREMLSEADDAHAVTVVKHGLVASAGTKMDGQAQTSYPRKLWSSVCLWNTDHRANRRLSLHDINTRPGRDLHAFYHLHDDEIGALDPAWNVLVGEEDVPDDARILHWTLGGPFTPGWAGQRHDALWRSFA